MFGILITSAVITWHFVYLTVLFFFMLFSFMVAITGWMVHSLLREANDRAVGLWRWRREGGGEVPPSVWQTEAKADRRPQLSSLCEAGGLWRGHPPVLFPLPSLDDGDGRVVVGGGDVGGLFSLFWHCLWWSRWSGTTHSSCRWRLTGWGHKRPAVVTKRHELKRAG